MNNSSRGWMAVLATLIFASVVGVLAYQAGITQGAARGGTTVISATAPAGPAPYYPYYPVYRPWGVGGLFLCFFLCLAFLSAVRGIFGRSEWWRDGCGSRMEEWHRRMHERMGEDAPSGGTAGR